tara:strand:- start:110 stop:514 length:405 start_codon:yes stop_codon:yes gene_type:complete
MNRKISTLLLLFAILFFVGFHTHVFILEKTQIELPFSLQKIYLFHAVFSTVLCVNFVIFSRVDKVFQQIAFIYLATILLKIILFCTIFYKPLFAEESLTKQHAISLLVPLFLFLSTEAFFVIQILNTNSAKTIK